MTCTIEMNEAVHGEATPNESRLYYGPNVSTQCHPSATAAIAAATSAFFETFQREIEKVPGASIV